MLNLRLILKFLETEYMVRCLYFLLLIAIIPFFDCFIILLTARYLGEYLFLSILLAGSLAGFLFSVHLIRKNLRIIHTNTENHYFSEYYYNMLPGTFLISFFYIMPGILGSIIAMILTIPVLRFKTGTVVSGFLKVDWKEIHEVINIID